MARSAWLPDHRHEGFRNLARGFMQRGAGRWGIVSNGWRGHSGLRLQRRERRVSGRAVRAVGDQPWFCRSDFRRVVQCAERRCARGAGRRDWRVLGTAPSGSTNPRSPPFRSDARAATGHRDAVRRANPRRHDRIVARPDADPLLPRPRPSGSAARSPGPTNSSAARRVGPALLWFHRQRPGQADLHRQRAGPRNRHAARNSDHPARDLLRLDRRRVHAHPGSRPEILDPAQAGRRAVAQRIRCQGQAHHPDAVDRSRRVRGVLPEALRHDQAVRPGRRRVQYPGDARHYRDGGIGWRR